MNADALLKSCLAAIGLMLGALPAGAQGFAGLGTASADFAQPDRDRALQFPADHAAHPGYRIEWWYLTANLTGPDGTPMGLQWTLFRSALAPGGTDDGPEQLWMGHAAVTTPDMHLVAERLARGGIGQAGVTLEGFEAFIDDWAMRSTGGADPLDSLRVSARGTDFAYDIDLAAQGPIVLQGDHGYSMKSAGGAVSYYYSQPFYEVAGTVTLPSGPVEVTGQAWLDREWSSQPLAEDQTGWDWISLHLDSGAKLMGFGLRSRDGGHFTSATWVAPSGEVTSYGDGTLQLEPLAQTEVAGRRVPTRWRVRLPDQNVDLEIDAVNGDAWMDTAFPYWEGPVRITGSHGGRGYLEMTGYE